MMAMYLVEKNQKTVRMDYFLSPSLLPKNAELGRKIYHHSDPNQ